MIQWAAFFTMEIRYVQKLKARRKALGLKAEPDSALDVEFLSGAVIMSSTPHYILHVSVIFFIHFSHSSV